MSSEYPSVCVPKDAVVHGYLAGRRYLHAPLRFKYKAPWHDEIAKYHVDAKAGKEISEDAETQVTTEFIAGCLVSWDATDAAGSPLVISADNLNHLHRPLLERLGVVIMGYGESDEDPNFTGDTDGPSCADDLVGN